MNKFTLTFDIKPKVWQRVRTNHSTGAFFNANKMSSYQGTLKVMARKQMQLNNIPMMTSRLQVTMYFNFERPKKTKFSYPPKGDIDNFAKNVNDAFNKVVFNDDSQVAILYAQKRWAEKDSIQITIEEF